ncbi:hypothetical protein ABEB36_009349 [Hypothenemus hampei]|uniref:Uncharacterized protein n=1 Tax=Hypothenemus hampei TaxID=57062 RepID=A0ABD1EG35_HYPHA
MKRAQIELLGLFGIDPKASLRKISTATGISLGFVHKVTKLHKFRPYKIQICQALTEDDFERKIEFCEQMTKHFSKISALVMNAFSI